MVFHVKADTTFYKRSIRLPMLRETGNFGDSKRTQSYRVFDTFENGFITNRQSFRLLRNSKNIENVQNYSNIFCLFWAKNANGFRDGKSTSDRTAFAVR